MQFYAAAQGSGHLLAPIASVLLGGVFQVRNVLSWVCGYWWNMDEHGETIGHFCDQESDLQGWPSACCLESKG